MPDQFVRRKIAARSSSWAIQASRLVAKAGCSPNQISMCSVGFAAGACVGLVVSSRLESDWVRGVVLVIAAVAIQLRLLCNLLDGLMAIEGGQKSATGDLYNDLPDRFSDALILVGAGYASAGVAFAIELGYLAAILAILTAYIRVLGASIGIPHDFSGPMAKQHRMALMTLACMIAALELLWHWNGETIVIALGIVIAGCVLTIYLRIKHIAYALVSRG